jgi:tetratricopeptide (TPR) repeat protein
MNIKESFTSIKTGITSYYEANKKRVQMIGLAAVALVGGAIYWTQFYMPSQEKEAEVKFAKLWHYFKTDSLDVVLKGDKANKIMSAVEIADKYSMTAKGKEASLMAGLSYLKKGEFKKALDYLDNFNGGDAILGPSAIAAKAACYSGLGELSKAADLYEKAAKLGENEYTSAYYQKAAVHYELTKDYSSALSCYETLESKYSATREGQEAEKYIYRLKGLMGELNK